LDYLGEGINAFRKLMRDDPPSTEGGIGTLPEAADIPEVHMVAKEAKKYLEDKWGVSESPTSMRQMLDLSTNREGGHSAYLRGPFGEIRISDHDVNPNFVTSNANMVNPSLADVKSTIDRGMDTVNKGILEGNALLEKWEAPRRALSGKYGEGWKDDFLDVRKATSKKDYQVRKAAFLEKYDINNDQFNALLERRPNRRLSTEQYLPKEGIGSLGGMAVEKTPEFKKWFRRSHVADSPTKEWNRGKPKLVYHGSNLGEEYDDSLPSEGKFLSGADKALGESQWMTDLGAWFTEDPDVAAHFAGTARKDVSPQIYPAYLSLQNPMYFDTYEDLEEAFDESGLDNVIEWVEALQAKDWDGIIIENSFTDVPTRRTDYVAFKPTQIKSQFNVGTFDPEDADISKASGGFVTLPEFAEGGSVEKPVFRGVGHFMKNPVQSLVMGV